MSSNKKEPPQPGEQHSSQEPTMSSTELQTTEEDTPTPAQTGAVQELGKSEVTIQESPRSDSRLRSGEDVHDKTQLEKTESGDLVQEQTRKYDEKNEDLEPNSQPSQSTVNTSTADCTVTAERDRTVVSSTGQEDVSEKSRSYSTLEDSVEDSRDGFGMQIVETSPGQGKNKKKAGRKRKKGEKSLKPRKLRLILPHPEGAEGEGSSAEFLDPSFESHLEDIGRNYSLSTTNVKSILHRVITNENVVAMMRHSVKEDQGEDETEGDCSPNNPLAELFEPKMTRARAKEVAEKGSFVVPWPISPVKKPADSQPAKFIDLSFEEDEDDDEYEPDDDENEESDIDSIASREASDFGSPMPSTPRQFLHAYSESDRRDDSEDTDDKPETAEQGGKSLEPHIKIQPIPMGPPLPPLSKEKTDAAFLSELDTFDEELSELSGRTARSAMDFNAEDNLGLIANRTRSKCPLKDTPIDIIEAAFHAPDITQDMYDTECDDSEWQGWLKGLFKTDLDMSGDADDEQNDPDYNFLQEEEEVDTEDLRDDRAVRITKKEVNELMDELLQQYEEEMEQLGGDPAPGLDDSTTVDPLTPPPSRTFVKPPPISFDGPLSTVMAKTHKTVQQQLQEEKTRKKDPGAGRKVQSLPVLTQEERQQLKQQMQQHVQLLCQVHVLTREEPQLQEVAQVTKNFLKENQMFVQRSTQLYQMQVEQYKSAGAQVPQVEFCSMFDTCNLQGAVDIVDQTIPVRPFTASPVKKTGKSKGPKAKPSASSQATIAESKVFMYPALLPSCAPVQHDPIKHAKEKPCFLPAEDNLLALGMQQYQGMSTVEMIHYIRDNMIPTKTSEQIRIRIKNLKANKKKTGNIVQVFSKTKQLPALPMVCPDMEVVQAVPPAHLQGKHLPEWLQEYQQTSQQKTEPLQSKKMRNLSPKKSEKLSPTQRGILPKGFVPVMSVKKALFQSPSKVQTTVNTSSSSSSTSATISTPTTENTAKTLQTLAPKSTDVSHIGNIDSSTPVYIMLPSNVVPGNLSQTSPPVPGLQGSVQPLGGAAAGGVFVVVSPTSTTASVMTQAPQAAVSSTAGQTVENACLQSSPSNSVASNVTPREADTPSRVESSSTVTSPSSSLVESTCVTSTTDPVPDQTHVNSQSIEREAIDSRESELPCEDSVVTSIQMQGHTPQETTTSDVPLTHTTSPGLASSKDTFPVQETVTNNPANADVVFVEEISTSVHEGNQNLQSPLQVVEATNLPEAMGPETNVAGTIPDEESGTKELESVSEEIRMVEDSGTPVELHKNQITQDVASEQTVRTDEACLEQPFTLEQPETPHAFAVQNDRTERPCLEQPCTEQLQPSVPQSVEGITAHPSEEAHLDQVVSEDNPVVLDDGLVSSTEEQDLLAKEVEAEQGADVEGQMSEEQSTTSKRMVMVKKKAKRRRKQLQKDMASTLLLLDSDLMDRDPLREERETMMAKNFLERVRDSLRDEEGKYHEVLQVFHQGHQEGKTIVQLYQELRRVLARWPVLLGEFAAFLQPAEAVECDLFMEHQEYVQARSFLRKLEVFFSENPDHYQKVLRVFASYMREGASLEGLRQEITPLLQGQPYLLQEFTRFFPDLPPPQSMMGDFEEIHMASDSDGDEVPDNFEEIVLPEEDEEEVSREKKQVDPWKLLLAQKHGTKECRCECHESSTDLRVQRRNRHCVACNTKLTPKDLQAKKDIILRHQALLHTRESPVPDRTRRKIPAKRGRKKTDSETARDSPSLDTAMVEESCSSPLNQDDDLAGNENSSNTEAGHSRKGRARSQKSSSHQTSELAKFCPLGSGLETGTGEDEEETRKSTNEEDAEESSQESDEELEQVTEEAVRNLRDLCEEIPAPDWQKSATIVESFRRRLQEIAQHEFTEEEEEEEEEEDEDEDKLSSGDESQDAEFSDLEEASGSGSASPSSLQALSAATSPGAASQGSEESPKAHTTSGHSLQALSAAISPGTALQVSEASPKEHTTPGHSQLGLSAAVSPGTVSQGSQVSPKEHTTPGHGQQGLFAAVSPGTVSEGIEESPKTHTISGLSQQGASAATSPGTALQGSKESTKAHTISGQSQQGLSDTTSPGAAAAVMSPCVAFQVGEDLPKAHALTEQSETVELEAVASQVSRESPKASTPRGNLSATAMSPGTTVQGTESPKSSKTMGRSETSELETAKMTGIENKQGMEMGQDDILNQRNAGDKLRQELGNNAVKGQDVISRYDKEEDRRTFRESEVLEQDKNTVEMGGNISEDIQRTGSPHSGTQSEYSDTQHDPKMDTPSDTIDTSHLGRSGTSGIIEDVTAESLSQGGDKEEMETRSARHEEDVSTRSEDEDEKMEVTEGQVEPDEKSSSGDGTTLWTRDQDRILLQACQQQGATPETFSTVAEELGDRTPQQVTDRFMTLMALYHQGTSTDEETGTDGETEEEEGSEYSTEQDNVDPVEMEDD